MTSYEQNNYMLKNICIKCILYFKTYNQNLFRNDVLHFHVLHFHIFRLHLQFCPAFLHPAFAAPSAGLSRADLELIKYLVTEFIEWWIGTYATCPWKGNNSISKITLTNQKPVFVIFGKLHQKRMLTFNIRNIRGTNSVAKLKARHRISCAVVFYFWMYSLRFRLLSSKFYRIFIIPAWALCSLCNCALSFSLSVCVHCVCQSLLPAALPAAQAAGI